MKEQLIEFKTAVLAKKCGFDWKCNYFKDKKDKKAFLKIGITNGKLVKEIKNWKYKCIPPNNIAIPTQSLLQKWLREEHEIFIEVCKLLSGAYIWHIYYTIDLKKKSWGNKSYSYEETLENGLIEALKLIKKLKIMEKLKQKVKKLNEFIKNNEYQVFDEDFFKIDKLLKIKKDLIYWNKNTFSPLNTFKEIAEVLETLDEYIIIKKQHIKILKNYDQTRISKSEKLF